MPMSSKCTMHFRWSFIFSTYGLYFLPGSNFDPFEEVKVPVSNSAEFFPKSAPWEDFDGFGMVRVGNIGNYLITKWLNYYPKDNLMWSWLRRQSTWKIIFCLKSSHFIENTSKYGRFQRNFHFFIMTSTSHGVTTTFKKIKKISYVKNLHCLTMATSIQTIVCLVMCSYILNYR